MKPTEVIVADSHKRGINPSHVLSAVQHLVASKRGAILHRGDTTLVLRRMGPGVAEAHLFTHDTPLTLARILVEFFHQMKSRGIRRLYGTADTQDIINMYKQLSRRLGGRVLPSDLPKYNLRIDL